MRKKRVLALLMAVTISVALTGNGMVLTAQAEETEVVTEYEENVPVSESEESSVASEEAEKDESQEQTEAEEAVSDGALENAVEEENPAGEENAPEKEETGKDNTQEGVLVEDKISVSEKNNTEEISTEKTPEEVEKAENITFSMLKEAADGEEQQVPVQIRKVKADLTEETEEATIQAGEIHGGEIQGYTYQSAQIDGVTIDYLGYYEGQLYYHLQGEEGINKVGDKKVVLTYVENTYPVTVEIVDVEGNPVPGAAVVEAAEKIGVVSTYSFLANPAAEYEISGVYANENLIEKTEGAYVLPGSSSPVNIRVVVKTRGTVPVNAEIDKDGAPDLGSAKWIQCPETVTADGKWQGVLRTYSVAWKLTHLVINNVDVKIPTGDGALIGSNEEVTEKDGMRIKVQKKYKWGKATYDYTISVEGVAVDASELSVRAYVTQEDGIWTDGIYCSSVEGAEVYYLDGEELKKVTPGEKVTWTGILSGKQIFYIKVLPGYENVSISGEGTDPNALCESDRPEFDYMFYYTGNYEDHRSFQVEAQPISYRVQYMYDGMFCGFVDSKTYSLRESENKIVLTNIIPDILEGESFKGWKIAGLGDKVYAPGSMVTMTEEMVQQAEENERVLVLEAVTENSESDASQEKTAGYVVKYLAREAGGEEYKEILDTKTYKGIVDTTAVAEVKEFSGYTLEKEKSTLEGTITADSKLELKVCYVKDEEKPTEPENPGDGGDETTDGNETTGGGGTTGGGTTTITPAATGVLGARVDQPTVTTPEAGVLGERVPETEEAGVLGERRGAGTGDETPIFGWVALAGCAAAALTFMGFKRRKKEEN